jgi:hypothetical protein
MAEFVTPRTALLLYWLNILAFGVLLLVSWRYAKHAGLVEADVSAMTGLVGRAVHFGHPGTVCVRGRPVRLQHLLEHRIYHTGPAQLRDRTPYRHIGSNLASGLIVP